ncbi:hypothetical protein HKCCE3408_00520 [Rhodobacterales bacterium HKCCE3408]|nr:hypothetical protein [Rhodobacterales bacterium HKCCE3408]
MLTHVFILEHDVIVAQDIAETAHEFLPGARICVSSALDQFRDALREAPLGQAVAIVDAGSAELRDAALAELLGTRRARVIAIAEPQASATGADWIFLPPPFSTTALLSALRKAQDGPGT